MITASLILVALAIVFIALSAMGRMPPLWAAVLCLAIERLINLIGK